MTVVSMNFLLESGVHFGHQTKRWNPKMKEYIHTSRDGIYIIDLQITAEKIEEAYAEIVRVTEEGGKVLFVGTRKQASQAIKDEALRSNSFFVCERWLGGTLTNFKTIRKRIKRLEELEKMEEDGTYQVLPKKEVIGLRKEYQKLHLILEGIRDMHKLPAILFVVDPMKEEIAVKEARKLKIPVIGIVDTNCDPDLVDYVIPGNDDAIRAVKLITALMANAINTVTGGSMLEFGATGEVDGDAEEIMKRAVETVKRKELKEDDGSRPQHARFTRRNNDRSDRNEKRLVREKIVETEKDDKPIKDEKTIIEKEKAAPNFEKVIKEEIAKPTEKVVEPKKVAKATKPKETKKATKPVKTEKPKKVEKPVKEEKKVAKTAKTKPVKEAKKVDLEGLTLAQLKEMAKEKKIKGYSTMKKAELIKTLN